MRTESVLHEAPHAKDTLMPPLALSVALGLPGRGGGHLHQRVRPRILRILLRLRGSLHRLLLPLHRLRRSSAQLLSPLHGILRWRRGRLRLLRDQLRVDALPGAFFRIQRARPQSSWGPWAWAQQGRRGGDRTGEAGGAAVLPILRRRASRRYVLLLMAILI